MAYSFRFENPIKAGTLVREKVRCGRPNCHCSKGKTFHEAWYIYYRDYTRPDKKLRKKYVRKEDFALYQMMLPLGRLVDKYHTLTMPQKLTLAHKALGEEYDWRDDWYAWVMRSDMDDERKRKILRGEPLVDHPSIIELCSWVLVFTPQENGNYVATSCYRRDD